MCLIETLSTQIYHGTHKQKYKQLSSYDDLQTSGMVITDANCSCSQYLRPPWKEDPSHKETVQQMHGQAKVDNYSYLARPPLTRIDTAGSAPTDIEKLSKWTAFWFLENSNVSYASFAEGRTVTRSAERSNAAETAERRFFGALREQMAEDIRTSHVLFS